MRLITGTPPFAPRTCAALPGRIDREGYIDTGQTISGFDPHIYISLRAAREMGRLAGMHTKEDVETIQAQVEALGEDLADALERLDDLTQLNELTEKVTA